MNIKVGKVGKKLFVFLMSVLLVAASIVPMVLTENVVGATNNITIYFDTSGCASPSDDGCIDSSHGTHDWSIGMTDVYYYAYGSNDTGLVKMTDTGESGSASGSKLLKATIDSDKYNKIIFSSKNYFKYVSKDGKTDKLWQTTGIDISGDCSIYRLSGSNYIKGSEYMQGVYKSGTYKPAVDYAGTTFQISNLTKDAVTLKLRYENEAGDYRELSYVIPARTLSVNVDNSSLSSTETDFIIPAAGDGQAPYTKMSIIRDSTTLKTYYFADGKMPGSAPGNTFAYGVTQYATDKISGEADARTAYFYRERYSAPPAVSGKRLYIGDIFDGTPASNIKLVRDNGSEITFDAVTTIGKAKYVTSSNVDLNAGEVFSIMCGSDRYNLIWDDTSKDLVTKIYDALYINSKYDASSTIAEGVTVNSTFFDYYYSEKDSRNPVEAGNNTDKYAYGGNDRPYQVINEAISDSEYGQSFLNGQAGTSTDKGVLFDTTLGDDSIHNKPPMYLGGFWRYNDYNEYLDDNAKNEKAGRSRVYSSDPHYGDSYGKNLYGVRYGANLAYRPVGQESGDAAIYNTVAQGLVDNQLGGNLNDGYILKANGQDVPYFSQSWWSAKGLQNYVWYRDNVSFPFFKSAASSTTLVNGNNMLTPNSYYTKYTGDYYVFDSQKDIVYLDKTSGQLSYSHNGSNSSMSFIYDKWGNGKDVSSTKGIFPFNNTNPSLADALNYGFGTRFDFDFYLNEAGTIDGEEDGIPITFTFQGDDDVWVFLDDQLLLDMGGDHKNALGEINFASKKIYISSVAYANTNFVEQGTTGTVDGNYVSNANPTVWKVDNVDFATANPAFANGSMGEVSDYLKTGKHRLTMYYMERGMFNSNLFVMFNLPQDTTLLDIQEDTDFGRVNAGFLDATKIVADNDVFNYSIENKGTDKANDITSNYKTPTRENLERVNPDISATDTTVIAVNEGRTSQDIYGVDKTRFYLKTNPGWREANAQFAAYVVRIDGTAQLVIMEPVSGSEGYYSMPYDSKIQKIKFLRLPGGYTYQTKTPGVSSTDYWNNSMDYLKGINGTSDGYWNEKNDIEIFTCTTNCIEITGWGNTDYSNGTPPKVVVGQKDTSTYDTYDFSNGGNKTSFMPVQSGASQGVTYKLWDMFMEKDGVDDASASATFNTRQYGGSGNYNVLSLQYGQMGNFKKQFSVGSEMKVTQMDTLSSAVKSDSDTTKDIKTNGYNDTTYTRSVAAYYDTYAKSTIPEDARLTKPQYAGIYDGDDVVNSNISDVVTLYGGTITPKNYSILSGLQIHGNETSYDLVDPSDSANRNAHMRQVFVNAVKAVDLTISKQVEKDTTDVTDEFVITVTFSNVFGSPLGDSEIDMSQVGYYKNGSDVKTNFENITGGSGSFTLRAGDSIIIKDIPVGTHYEITEAACTNYVLNATSSLNLDGDLLDETGSIVMNTRKTGDLEIVDYAYENDTKAGADTSYTTANTDRIDSEADFTFTVTLTVPTGVDLNGYVETNDTKNPGDLDDPTKWTQTSPGVYTKSYTTKLNKLNTYNTVSDSIHTAFATDESLKGLPFGVEYSVTQGSTENFIIYSDSPVYTNGKSVVKTAENRRIDHVTDTENPADRIILKYVSKPAPIVMPSTGGTPLIFLFPFGITAIAIFFAALVIYKKKMTTVDITESRRGNGKR